MSTFLAWIAAAGVLVAINTYVLWRARKYLLGARRRPEAAEGTGPVVPVIVAEERFGENSHKITFADGSKYDRFHASVTIKGRMAATYARQARLPH